MATLEASGSAGFDGWTATEVLALQKHLTPLADELYELWCATTEFCHNNPEPCPELSALLWSWKVVGIPKKVPSESRPISVASILVRVWHKALLKVLPPPPPTNGVGKLRLLSFMPLHPFLRLNQNTLLKQTCQKPLIICGLR